MALAVDTLSLGPIGTNCYLVRPTAWLAEAVVVDPSGDAAELRLRLARRGRAARRSWSRTATGTTSSASPTWRRAPARRCTCPRASAIARGPVGILGRAPWRSARTRRRCCSRRRDARPGGHHVRGRSPSPATRPPTSPTTPTAALFSGDVLFAGSVGRTDLPGADWDTLLDSIRRWSSAIRRRRSSTRATARDDARRRARAQPVPRRASRARERASRRRAGRTTSCRPSSRSGGSSERWSELCALYGYRPIQTPVFEDTELFARTSGRGLGRRAEGDVHVHRPRRPLADAAPEATAPIARAYVEHGLHREPQPVKLYTIAPMYRYGAPGRGRYREHWQLVGRGDRLRRPGDRRRADPALRHAAPPARRHGVPAGAELDRRRARADPRTSSG